MHIHQLRAYLVRLAGLFSREQHDREFAEELESHLQLHIEDNLRAGLTPQEARRQALIKLGGVEPTKEKYRRQRGLPLIETLIQDLRFGLRISLKHPGFTIVAVMTLALGVGANTAIFSVVNAVFLRPLPYIDPQRLVVIESGNKQSGPQQLAGVSPADFWDWQEQSTAFEHLAAYSGGGFSLTGVENPESIPQARVSASFFPALGAKPLLGRLFTREDELMGSPAVIVLSYRFWQRRFGGDPAIIGKTLGDTGTTVIGVMPPDFRYSVYAECWVPLARNSGEMKNRANRYFSVIGLLRLDQTMQGAQAELRTIASRLEAQYPDTNKNITVQLTLFRDRLVRNVKSSLLILLGAVGLVLLIACVNVASLLLARAASRRKEIAVRLALGASRWRLMRQLLTENMMLACAGGVVGLLLALWSKDSLIALLPDSYADLQLADQAQIDGTVLLFTLLVAVLTSLIFGVMPAWKASRPAASEWLKESSRSSDGRSHQRTRSTLLVTEIALALVLLVGAGLLIQSFVRLRRVDLGFDPRHLFSVSISVPFAKYPNETSRVLFIKGILEQVAQTPGVEAAAISSGMPFPHLNFTFNIEGRPLPVEPAALYDSISPNYFRALRARMLAGREFTEYDRPNSPSVAIINESLARQYFAGEDAIGKRVTINYLGRRQTREIVGIIRDLSQGELGTVKPQIYVLYEQQPWLSASLLVRAAGDVSIVRKDVQRAIWSVAKAQPVAKFKSVEQALGDVLAEPRLYTSLLGGFAGLALVLAAIGIYGVMAYSVTQRTHEIGIRMALGAQPRDILKLVVGQGLQLTLIGVAIGLGAALLVTQVMQGLLYGVSPTDPVTFLSIALLLIGVALVASYVPARRAMKVEPVIALRNE